jgi:hypothetical protein
MIAQQRTGGSAYPPSTDPAGWRAWVAQLDDAARLALFGVERDSTTFLCPTNGLHYADDDATTIDGARWARCFWCDTHGRVRVVDRDFDDRARQPHPYPILREATHARD